MIKEEVLDSVDGVCRDINKCIMDIINAKLTKDTKTIGDAHYRMEGMIVEANQELSFLRDYIDENIKEENNG